MKRLYRSRKDAMLGGVCGGLAEYFNIDPTIVRIAFAVTMLAGGVGVLAYFLAWIIVPEAQPGEEDFVRADNRKSVELSGDKVRMIIGLGFIALGVLFFINQFAPWFNFEILWPVVLIMIGALILLKGRGE